MQWVPFGVDVEPGALSSWFTQLAPHVRFVTCYAQNKSLSVRSGWRAPDKQTPYAVDHHSALDQDFYVYYVNQDAIVPVQTFTQILAHVAGGAALPTVCRAP